MGRVGERREETIGAIYGFSRPSCIAFVFSEYRSIQSTRSSNSLSDFRDHRNKIRYS